MASRARKKPIAKNEDVLEVKEVEIQETTVADAEVVEALQEEATPAEVVEPVEEEEIIEEPAPRPEVNITVYRDNEGRLVLAQEGKPRRIAGSDDAFPEVARQFASDFIKERQI